MQNKCANIEAFFAKCETVFEEKNSFCGLADVAFASFHAYEQDVSGWGAGFGFRINHEWSPSGFSRDVVCCGVEEMAVFSYLPVDDEKISALCSHRFLIVELRFNGFSGIFKLSLCWQTNGDHMSSMMVYKIYHHCRTDLGKTERMPQN